MASWSTMSRRRHPRFEATCQSYVSIGEGIGRAAYMRRSEQWKHQSADPRRGRQRIVNYDSASKRTTVPKYNYRLFICARLSITCSPNSYCRCATLVASFSLHPADSPKPSVPFEIGPDQTFSLGTEKNHSHAFGTVLLQAASS